MASTINADTSNGLVLTPDTSGEIKLQAGGADIATVTSSGITMASGKTLPASALTGTVPSSSVNALSTATSSTSQPSYSVRAWIKWNGNIGGGINGSGGVSSFSRGGTGDYDIFWSVTLDDANYAVTCCSGEQRVDRGLSSNGLATNKVTMVYEDTGGTRVDGGDLCIMMIR